MESCDQVVLLEDLMAVVNPDALSLYFWQDQYGNRPLSAVIVWRAISVWVPSSDWWGARPGGRVYNSTALLIRVWLMVSQPDKSQTRVQVVFLE